MRRIGMRADMRWLRLAAPALALAAWLAQLGRAARSAAGRNTARTHTAGGRAAAGEHAAAGEPPPASQEEERRRPSRLPKSRTKCSYRRRNCSPTPLSRSPSTSNAASTWAPSPSRSTTLRWPSPTRPACSRSSPATRVVDGGRIVTGEPARARSRLQPRQTSSRFWSALSMEPGSAGADIAQERRRARVRAARVVVATLRRRRDRRRARRARRVSQRAARPAARARSGMRHAGSRARGCGGRRQRPSVSEAAAHLRRREPAPRVRVAAEQNGEAQVRAEHALGQGLAGLADTFAPPHRGPCSCARRASTRLPTPRRSRRCTTDCPNGSRRCNARSASSCPCRIATKSFESSVERDAVLGVAQGLYRAVIQLIAQHREPGKRLVVQLSDRVAALPGFVGELCAARRLADRALCRRARCRAACCSRAVDRGGAGRREAAEARAMARSATRRRRPADERRAPEPARRCLRARSRRRTSSMAASLTASAPTASRSAAKRIAKRRTVVLSAEPVCRALHCEVILRDGELKLRDLSSYGTFVNEKRIAGETTLKRADVIRIGSPGAELHVVDMEGAE